ncbi:Hypothetical predicted protein [Octopus vulgaris]|uniref:Uncharacterized protein n=1 Tax=Octopus vulgaris TaxID=6645 RepID=A0AA36BID6_OCTVU|nr:Hypothetical predicted protein [Octopus vulgaris]
MRNERATLIVQFLEPFRKDNMIQSRAWNRRIGNREVRERYLEMLRYQYGGGVGSIGCGGGGGGGLHYFRMSDDGGGGGGGGFVE